MNPNIEQDLAETRIKLQQVTEERDALRHEFDHWKSLWEDVVKNAKPDELAHHSWYRALRGCCFPKSHLIDGMATSTRWLVEYYERTSGKKWGGA